MREATIERYLKRQAEKYGAEVRKLVTPGRRHAPDRLVLWGGGRLDFVETKAPGKKPAPGQAREHARLWKRGFSVLVLDTHGKVDHYVRSRA